MKKLVLKAAEHECPECKGTGFAPATQPTRIVLGAAARLGVSV
jgi:hypothetical protein